MIVQKAISAKLDLEALQLLDEEASRSGRKRNRLLNDAVRHYVSFLDEARRREADDRQGVDTQHGRAAEVGKYILDHLTIGEHENIHFTARGIGTSEEDLLLRLIRRGIEEFSRRPFAYL